MRENTKEQISSLCVFLFAVCVCFLSYRLSVGSVKSPGPGFFPFYLGAILCLLSINVFAHAVAKRRAAVEREEGVAARINWKNICLTVILLALYPTLLHVLGFLGATFVLTALFLRFISAYRWSVVWGVGVAVAIISYLVFQYWLSIQFPAGIFGM